MKYMFASDVHGSAYYCRKMLEAYDEEKAERLVLLGDLLYHGPRNDLPKEYAPCGVQSFSIDGENAVVCHHREVKDHLVYLCLTVSAYCVDLIFSFI